MQNRRSVAGIALAVLSAAAFGAGGAFVPPLLEAGWSAGAASLVRTGGAALVLAIPAVLALRGRWRDVGRQWVRIAAYGGLAIAGTQFAYYQALARIPVGTALMIEYLAPVLLVVFTAVVARRFPARTVVLGSVLALGGLALVLEVGGQGPGDLSGVLFALAAAVLCASYFALSASIDLPPVGTAGLGMVGATLSTALFAALGLVPFSWSTRSVEFGGATLSPLVPLLFITLIATVAAYLTGIGAARLLGGRRASFLALGEVLAAIVTAALLLGQIPGPLQLLGAAVLLIGIVLVLRDGPAPAADGGVDAAATPERKPDEPGAVEAAAGVPGATLDA